MATNLNQKRLRYIDWVLILAVIVSVSGGSYYLGGLNERLNNLNEKIDNLYQSYASITDTTNNATRNNDILVRGVSNILLNGRLSSGLDMGVNSSGSITNWVVSDNNVLRMSYPQNQSWGTVFITVGKPVSSYPRASRDYSNYSSLEIELKGNIGNEDILIGLKDRDDPDDGSETKVRISNLSTEWRFYSFELSQFGSADLKHLYIVTEFVFDGNAETISVRNIRFR